MTASNSRSLAHRPRRPAWERILQGLLIVTVLAPGLCLAVPISPALGADPLGDALAEQQRLARLIEQQKAQLASMTKQQTQLSQQIASTQSDLGNVRVSIDQGQAEIDALTVQLDQVRSQYESIAAKETELRAELSSVVAKRDAKEKELEQRQAILAERLRQAYLADQTPMLVELLSSHSLTSALSDVSYLSSLADADKALADQIVADQRELATLEMSVAQADMATLQMASQVGMQKKALDDQAAQLADAQAQLEALKAKLEKQLADLNAAQDKLNHDSAALAAAIRSNGVALDQLGDEIDSLVAKYGGSGRIPSVYNGTLKWPMGGVITQDYGCTGVTSEPRVGSCAHFHQGIDMAAPCGTPIYASGAGMVVFVGYNPYDAPPQAWLVIIAHSTSLVTWYAHMSPRAPSGIAVGHSVASGQLVGWEDTTGHSTGCHLHWAVRVDGRFMNPRLFL